MLVTSCLLSCSMLRRDSSDGTAFPASTIEEPCYLDSCRMSSSLTFAPNTVFPSAWRWVTSLTVASMRSFSMILGVSLISLLLSLTSDACFPNRSTMVYWYSASTSRLCCTAILALWYCSCFFTLASDVWSCSSTAKRRFLSFVFCRGSSIPTIVPASFPNTSSALSDVRCLGIFWIMIVLLLKCSLLASDWVLTLKRQSPSHTFLSFF